MNAHHEATNKMQHFKNQAAKQRDKIRGLKNIEIEKQNEEEEQLQNLDVELPVSEKKSAPLTAENLERHAVASSKKGPSTTASRKGKKPVPAWAKTEK